MSSFASKSTKITRIGPDFFSDKMFCIRLRRMETPYGRLVEDSQILDGDPPCFLVGDPIFSLETLYFHWRPHIFIEDPIFSWRPHIFVGDPQILDWDRNILIMGTTFYLKTPRFSLETPIFSLETPKNFIEDPQIFIGNPTFFLDNRILRGPQWKSQ